MFEEMLIFVRVIEEGSFSGAARRLNLAKSAVSRRLAQLEDRLSVKLINRSTRRLTLTETGQAFFERARRILDDVAETEDILRSLHGELAGKLRVAAPMSFGVRHLSGAVARFMAAHPRVEVELDLNDRFVDLASEGFDLAVRIGNLKDSSLIARALAPCRHVICGAPSYLELAGLPATPEDLAAHTCLSYSNRAANMQWQLIAGDKVSTVRVRSRFVANNGDVLTDAAIAGLGLVALPTFIVADAIRAGQLEVVLQDFALPDPTIYAVWPQNRHLSTKVRAFVDHLVEQFSGVPYWDRSIANDQVARPPRRREG